jgi:uncharacterized membrane protein
MSGFVLVVPADEVIELDMTVEQGLKLIILMGTVVPDWQRDNLLRQQVQHA